MPRSSRNLGTMEVVFDDRNVVANGGLVLPMTLADRLGAKGLVDDNVDLGDAPGHANAGQKAMALVASALVGGDSIDDADVLRSGQATALLGTWVPAPSTLGTFLRSFSWADARSLDKVAGELLKRASAPRGALSYPLRSREGSEVTSLGPMAYLASKEKGDNSMPIKPAAVLRRTGRWVGGPA
jgi:hypothetical protein